MSPNNILVSTINGAGAAIETLYVVIFLAYAAKKERLKITALLLLVLAVFGAVAAVSLLALHGNMRKVFCGFAATVFSVCMYASPLSIMVREPCPVYLNLFLAIVSFVDEKLLSVCSLEDDEILVSISQLTLNGCRGW